MIALAHITDLSDSQKAQHVAVLKVVSFNVNGAIDALQSLEHQTYDEVLECLDSAKVLLEGLVGE